MVLILGAIVAWDAWWLTRQHRDIPKFGHLPNNGYAWKSERNHEMFRQWANLGSMAAMMALPWGFASFSNTPITYVIIWDVLLGLHHLSSGSKTLCYHFDAPLSQTGNVTSGPASSFLNVNQSTELCCYERAGVHSDHCRSGRSQRPRYRSRENYRNPSSDQEE